MKDTFSVTFLMANILINQQRSGIMEIFEVRRNQLAKQTKEEEKQN